MTVTEVKERAAVAAPPVESGAMVPRPDAPPPAARAAGVMASAESIDGLFRLAIEKGVAAGELRELVALHDQVTQRLARQAYFEALAAFQRDMEPVVRTRQADVTTRDGGGMKYKFANADDVLTTVRPTLLQHGLSVKFDQKLEAGQCTGFCTVMHVAGHSETSSFTVPTESRAGMSPQQKVGAAMSYAQARVLGIALGFTTTDAEPDAIDPTPITKEQADEISQLVHDKKIDPARVLKFLGVDAINEIRAMDYLKAVAALDAVQVKSR